MSAARPKIADYPFTTLVPNLGVIRSGDTVYTMADVPGLIPGASTGKGLGVQFLRHVERCAVLVHVVDMATMEPGRDPESDIEALEHELAEYGGDELDLVGRLRIAVLNKIDVPDARELVDLVRASPGEARPGRLPGQRRHRRGPARVRLRPGRAPSRSTARACPPMEPARVTITPKAVDDSGFTVERDPERRPDGFVVRGVRPERWVRQTDFTNDEAVGFLADRLNRLGVEEELAKAGAREGDAVTIGGVTFDWVPTLPAGTLTVEESAGLGGRGTDARIDAPHRVRAEERLAAKKARRVPYELSDETWTDDDLPADLAVTEPRRRRAPAVRPQIAGARRVVVKVGSSSLTTLPGGLDAERLSALVDVLGAVRGRRPRGRAGLLRRDRGRAGAAGARAAGRATSPPRRPRPASASCGWCRPTPTPSPGTASPSARCC